MRGGDGDAQGARGLCSCASPPSRSTVAIERALGQWARHPVAAARPPATSWHWASAQRLCRWYASVQGQRRCRIWWRFSNPSFDERWISDSQTRCWSSATTSKACARPAPICRIWECVADSCTGRCAAVPTRRAGSCCLQRCLACHTVLRLFACDLDAVRWTPQLDQKKREKAVADFKAGAVHVLLATDVAARGLHINKLQHVINFDMAQTVEMYTHRIGRTGRQGIHVCVRACAAAVVLRSPSLKAVTAEGCRRLLSRCTRIRVHIFFSGRPATAAAGTGTCGAARKHAAEGGPGTETGSAR
jgi:hypothetical protein